MGGTIGGVKLVGTWNVTIDFEQQCSPSTLGDNLLFLNRGSPDLMFTGELVTIIYESF